MITQAAFPRQTGMPGRKLSAQRRPERGHRILQGHVGVGGTDARFYLEADEVGALPVNDGIYFNILNLFEFLETLNPVIQE